MPADASSESEVLCSLSLRILATSDLHANLHPYNYYTDRPQNTGGLARLGRIIAQLRAASDNCILVDNGDTLQGTPLGDFAAQVRSSDGRPHPMVAAMNVLGYDAMTLGNHDFNYGLDFLQSTLSGAAFPAVLANIRRTGGTPLLPPWVILDRDMRDTTGRLRRLKIGLIGLAPPQTLKWDRSLLEGQLEAEDILDAARREVRAMRDAGADLVIVLCHSGVGPAHEYPDMENAAVPLAALHGVDALVAGHTHELFPGPCSARPDWIDPEIGTIHGTPVVQPGHEGSHLGVIDLILSEVGKDRWRVSANQSHLVPVCASEPCSGNEDHALPASTLLSNSDVMSVTAQDHIATLGYVRQRVGETLVPLESYFALLGNSAAVQVVADAQRDYAERMLRGHELGHLPLLSAAAPFRAGGRGGPQNYTDVPAGPLAIKNASDLYIYPNTVAILRTSGAQLTDWLERAACAFHQLVPGLDDQLLINHAFAAYNFDVIDGLTYAIDVTAPPCYSADGEDRFPSPGRIRNLCHDGRPVQPDQEFLVVTNSYRAAGGGHFASAAAAEPVLKRRMPVRDILIGYVRHYEKLRAITNQTWRFAPAGGIRAIAEIGPGALSYPDRVAEHGLDYLGRSQNGFARFAITL
ncbi:bifunctional 2',3'-cyclic-nucleotide 2'-phosphodiesterase/3'-nucleotidase [Rhodophyticola porphyridii]|uniref:Bifunctional 2',3'-cyclic-nucleotide 2'-phosphodiesterase/3'-nucleotidase n=1 Tax=Rhodophyticola porphyridii TaxID=1852017 RepID=A0A3L9Y9C7_9RHOB|nr:bifunctional 2',3'-cyclic-nucleotide 2'-phosphodiesterase/3'-nucleotidase [Rhodophyticola porphyridii]RMA43737.1 bifunctional 2',3'-cyclic-nucleotide 2'-phosphodiesterase/3'-nucleotidase [Rhodophyticola porphyridii]